MTSKEKTYIFPKALGRCADQLYQLREKRLAGQRAVDELEAEEKALKQYIIDHLPKSEASGVAGKLARVTVVTRAVPQLEDWEAFTKHIKKTGQFDLLQHRLTAAAVEARWDDGKTIPGVSTFNVVTLSINKV